jgi:transcriptional regulator with XRE-family HTH domain
MNEDHVAEQLAEAMETQGITKLEMAARMKTSRRQLDRLFDPSIPSVTPDTFRRAANAVGRRFASNWCDALAKPQASLISGKCEEPLEADDDAGDD